MLSNKILQILKVLTRLGVRYGAFCFSYDDKTKCFKAPASPETLTNFKINHNLCVLWFCASILLLFKYYNFQDYESFYVNLVFWLGGATMLACVSISRWYRGQLLVASNGSLIYFQKFQSKFFHQFNHTHFLKVIADSKVIIPQFRAFHDQP